MVPGENPERVILHVDMNAYFASVEQKSNPLLRGKPLVVVADSRRRGVILTASYEARAFGIKTGMNLWEGKKLCPHVTVVDGNTDKYLHASAQILEILETFSHQVEMSSCDEAYLDVTASQTLFGTDGAGIGQMVKDKIRREIGLPCSVGVAPNKALAKMGSDRKKPDGLTVVTRDTVAEFMKDAPIQDMCGIGHRMRDKMNAVGIYTCGDLAKASRGWVEHHFGFWGYWLKRLAEGKDDTPVKRINDPETVKSVGHSTTFPADSWDLSILRSYLLLLSEKVACRLRKMNLQGRTVSLYIRYNDFSGFGKQVAKKEPTDDGTEIYKVAEGILKGTLPLVKSVRLFGVSVSSLVENPWQEFLLAPLAKKKSANEAVDTINKKYGRFTVKPAGLLVAEKHGILAPPIPPYMNPRKEL